MEISAAQFESEIREGRPIVILDVRDPASFDEWRIDPDGRELVNIPAARVEADAADVARSLAAGERPVRVICTRGQTSRSAAAALRDAGVDAVSVRGGMVAWAGLLTPDEVPLPSGATVVQFRREARGCLSYLIVADGEALAVDPAPDIAPYEDEARRRSARITAIVDTHVHADHLSGARDLAAATGAPLYLSHGAVARGAEQTGSTVSDGDTLSIGSSTVTIRELPGHTSDNIGLIVDGAALVAGDSLFADSVARPDLEAGDAGASDAARLLHHTLHERILPLDREVVLLPCHYEGGRRARPVAPTLGEVRDTVHLLALGEDAFVHEALEAMPPRPANYEQIIAANLRPRTDPALAGLEVGANNCATTSAAR